MAGYHLLYWLDIAILHAFGSYGVYLFFVLSRASLAHTYAGRLAPGARAFGLAPLHLLLMAIVLPSKLRAGWRAELATNIALNVTFPLRPVGPGAQCIPDRRKVAGHRGHLLSAVSAAAAHGPAAFGGWPVFGALVLP